MGEAAADNYQVNIPLFEGPLDLLLHLVTKNRIDIHDIPIHMITDQYLAYLESARQFNLDLGSSFFAMASTLILIKSRMLLPEKRREEMDESEDPRQELSRSLEEFKRMKEVKARIEALMEEESRRAHLHLVQIGDATALGSSNQHLEMIAALKEINSKLATIGYAILDKHGALRKSRLRTDRLKIISGGEN